MALNFHGTNVINSLSLGGYMKIPGIYGAFASGEKFITGSGVLMVTNGPAPTGTIMSIF